MENKEELGKLVEEVKNGSWCPSHLGGDDRVIGTESAIELLTLAYKQGLQDALGCLPKGYGIDGLLKENQWKKGFNTCIKEAHDAIRKKINEL